MPSWIKPLIIVLCLMSASCARLQLLTSDQPPQQAITEAREAGRFERALALGGHIRPEHPEYEAVQQALERTRAAIHAFEMKHIRQAEAARARGEWGDALDILENALDRWPPSKPLLQARDRIRQAQVHHYKQLKGDLLLSEARWRARSHALARQLPVFARQGGDRQFRRWQARERQLAEDLARLASYFAGDEDWHRVREYLVNARKLVDDAGDPALLKQARETLAAAARQHRQTRQRQALEEARQRLQRYESTQRLDDLLSARRFLNRHRDNEALSGLRDKVEKLIAQRLRQDMQRGESLYAAGHYEQAYEVWKAIAPLGPDNNELQKKLERVEKVLSKLRSLEGP